MLNAHSILPPSLYCNRQHNQTQTNGCSVDSLRLTIAHLQIDHRCHVEHKSIVLSQIVSHRQDILVSVVFLSFCFQDLLRCTSIKSSIFSPLLLFGSCTVYSPPLLLPPADLDRPFVSSIDSYTILHRRLKMTKEKRSLVWEIRKWIGANV